MDRRRQGPTGRNVGHLQTEGAELHGVPVSAVRWELVQRIGKREPRRKTPWRVLCIVFLGVMSVVSTVLSILVTFTLEKNWVSISTAVEGRLVSKIAFGSCTASQYSSQPIWVYGVIPSDPDAWIWLGDMAYMDEPHVDCVAFPSHHQCSCTSDWLHQPPNSCMTGNVDHAMSRVQMQLSNPDYAQFLSFMCPDHRQKGVIPPTGSDSSICSRPILGTYDDHDFSWENGNKRLPHKDDIKRIFLDAIGEPAASPRRKNGHGIEWKYTLNEGRAGQEIDVILLDERYNRDTLPCHVRKAYCEAVLSTGSQHLKYAWCFDFLHGRSLGMGNCCHKDEKIFYGWCMQEINKGHVLYDEACNPASPLFGTRSLTVNQTGHLVEGIGLSQDDSPLCEVLGREQRLWLEDILLSNAPLKLIVSSSVVLGNPTTQICEDGVHIGDGTNCTCSGDDWECYKPAQLQLLNLVPKTFGCVVILTGDYHYSDIRVLRPNQEISTMYYQGLNLSYPLFQVMASGLTESTGPNFSCDGLRSDPAGLRDHMECNFVRGPSFGMVQVDWDKNDPIVRLQVRDGNTGTVKLESNLTLSSCLSRADS